ncbi:unnamed protein product [Brassica rapa]|uniref:Uncharacterized protein n=2 Tax=Brassica TaxID=3705 RepID=A0A8D9HQD2_BRACM|nr:unnamed protein product [Brassica napus]CAG7901759.1 unnamed protein product [Brassica rapa]
MVEKARKVLCLYLSYVASVLKDKSSKLMTEARGLDDVVKSQIGRHLHALDNGIKLHALPENHHVTQPESWNHHTRWRKTMVMESQTQTLVWLWYGKDHSFTVKPAFSVGSNLKPSAARKELSYLTMAQQKATYIIN